MRIVANGKEHTLQSTVGWWRKEAVNKYLFNKLLGEVLKAMTNLDSILKGRDITLPTKVCLAKAMVFPVVMYGCESWTTNDKRKWVLNIQWKDRCWSSNPLDTWWEELTHCKRSWCWERMKVGGEGDDRGWDGWMASPTRWTWVSVSSGSWWWTGKPGVLQFTESQTVGHD